MNISIEHEFYKFNNGSNGSFCFFSLSLFPIIEKQTINICNVQLIAINYAKIIITLIEKCEIIMLFMWLMAGLRIVVGLYAFGYTTAVRHVSYIQPSQQWLFIRDHFKITVPLPETFGLCCFFSVIQQIWEWRVIYKVRWNHLYVILFPVYVQLELS